MTKREKTRLIVWSAVGVALVAAIALYLLLPRRADRLMKTPDISEVYGVTLIDTVTMPDLAERFCTVTYSTRDMALVRELYDLLARTKVYFERVNGGVYIYDNPVNDGQLCDIYLWTNNTSVNRLTLRPDGAVFAGSVTYEIRDDAVLAEYMDLLERVKDSSRQEGLISGSLDSDKLAAYQALFDAPSWYAQAVAAPFRDGQPNLGQMFYDGLSYGDDGALVYGSYVTPEDGDEWNWVRQNVPGATEVDVSRLPRDGMYQALRETVYSNAELPDDLAPEGWTYWDKTDCWYHAHGDTGLNTVTLLSGNLTEGAGYFLFENAFGQTCRIDFVLGQTEENAGQLYLTACASAW